MDDAQLCAVLHGLGIDRDTRHAVTLLPLVHVAWADGRVQDKERALIEEIAERRGLIDAEGSRLLRTWLRHRPSQGYLERGRRALVELAHRGQVDGGLDGGLGGGLGGGLDEVVGMCRAVARAAGGLFDVLGTVSAEERDAIAAIARGLQVDRRENWQQLFRDADPGPGGADDGVDGADGVDGVDGAVDGGASERTDPHGIAPQLDGLPADVPGVDDPTVTDGPVRPRLRVDMADGDPQIEILDGAFTIGRRRDNDLVVGWDREASRQHARIWPDGSRWYVVDQGSMNGTRVSGEYVLERRLFGGERIQVGQTELLFLQGS